MATKNQTDVEVQEPVKKDAVQKKKAKSVEAVYSVDELATASESVFGYSIRKECVTAAFRDAGKDSATVKEAKEIVSNFMKREVD